MNFAKELLHESGKMNYQVNNYKGMGHLIDLPFLPPRHISHISYFPKPTEVMMGGDDKLAHTTGQIELWNDTLNFLWGKTRYNINNGEMNPLCNFWWSKL